MNCRIVLSRRAVLLRTAAVLLALGLTACGAVPSSSEMQPEEHPFSQPLPPQNSGQPESSEQEERRLGEQEYVDGLPVLTLRSRHG